MILSCFVMRMAQIMEQISALLQKGDEKEWKALADYVKAAIMRDYYGACNRTESYLSCVLFSGYRKIRKRKQKS